MCRFVPVALVAIVLGPYQTEAGGQAKELLDLVVRELPSAWRRMDAFFANAQCVARIREYSTPRLSEDASDRGVSKGENRTRDVLTRTAQVAFSASGGFRKLETMTPIKGPDVRKALICVGPRKSFRLAWVRQGEKDVPVVRKLEKGADEGLARTIDTDFLYYLKACSGSFLDLDLNSVMDAPGAIEQIEKVPGKKGDDLKLHLAFDFSRTKAARAKSAPPGRKISAWMIVSPHDGWAVRAIGPGRGDQPRLPRFEIEYGEQREGIALPTRIVFLQPGRGLRTEVDIDRIARIALTEREFSLPAYGLPDIDPKQK
jgi:hypothetical protein